MHWMVFALMTVVTWGLYGGFLNKGAVGFGHDRFKAFLFVGIAYFLIAVLAPLGIIASRGKGFDFPGEGIRWSLIAGAMGAIGALTTLFALNTHPLTAEKQPALAAAQVMALIFDGAPIVTAASGIFSRKQTGELSLDWRFIAGLVLAASGGALVTLFRPS